MQPVIILGMHRSGTSLLTRLLAQWGLFVGDAVEQNHEAVAFLKLNEWMFHQANASWDRPDNMELIDDELWLMLKQGAVHLLNGACKEQFLGRVKAAQYQNLMGLDFPWGWKDPRTIYTMPVWRKLYPTARLIHITRHPVDVAYSIASREQRRFADIKSLVKKSGVNSVIEHGQKFRTTVRCLNVNEGIALWKSYVGHAKRELEVSTSEVMSVQYEQLLENPLETARKIADFAGLSPSSKLLETSLKGIDSKRRYAFRKSEELTAIYKNICDDPLVEALGYSNLFLEQ